MDILNQFGVKPILLAAQVVNFLILLFILKKLLYKPILKVLDERKKRIEDSLKNAQEIERRLQQTTDQSDKIIAKTLKEAQKILDQTNQAAAQIMDQTNQAAEEILRKATKEGEKMVALEKEMLMQRIKEYVGSLVTLVVEKVTGKKITLKDQKEIIEKEVRNLS